MNWAVYYERPENTLNSIPGLTKLQAARLIESFEAQRIACSMEPDDGSRSESIVVHLPKTPGTYQAAMQETALRMVREAMERSGGNKVEAAELLGIPRTSLHAILKRLNDPGLLVIPKRRRRRRSEERSAAA